MNLIKLLRKPHLAFFLSIIMLLISCSQYGNDLAESNQFDKNDLINLHQKIKLNVTGIKFLGKSENNTLSKSVEEAEAERIYLENVEYYNKYGVEALFNKHKINTDIILALDYYYQNENKENIYQDLIDMFKISNERDASILFTIIEVKQIVEKELANSTKERMSNSEMQRLSWGCALAIASTVGVTLGVLFAGPITGGASLVGFLVFKGLATAALIEACGDGWGDIY